MIQSLGAVTVAGSAVQVTSDRVGCQRLRFQVAPANTGIVYIGVEGMDIAGSGFGTGVLAVLPIPVSATTGPFASYEAVQDGIPAGLDASKFYVFGTVPGDVVLVAAIRN